MAGLEPFGSGFEKKEPERKQTRRTPQPKPQPQKDVLDDEAALEELKKLGESVQSVDKGLLHQIEEVKKKKDALELALAPIKKELENLRKLMLEQLLASGATSLKGTTVNCIRTKRVNYTTPKPADKVKLAKAVGREDLLKVDASSFNKLCKQLEGDEKQLPSWVRKKESYTLTIRGV